MVLFTAYANSDLIGSFRKMHDLLSIATQENPVAGNAHGSYLTMRSKNGLIFGVINVVGYVPILSIRNSSRLTDMRGPIL
ncbi:hypothetical protein QFC19_007866 [Naganishia cerealis]|uniref:Uncharacterized protein n=1 Tax=Naganishia cerealis TaxID=610337 RepID=A0ACC2V6D9_9TREE|nr:hypothetical protein QFC19_007866 [Naganishia cerealis]